MTRLLRQRLRGERGVASLEMLAVVFLMLAITIGMWGIGLVIYNQTLLNTSTQFASQAAVVYWDRASSRSADTATSSSANSSARTAARNAAIAIFNANMVQRMSDQFAQGPTTSSVTSVVVTCAASWDITKDAPSTANCNGTGGEKAALNPNSKIARVQVTTRADGLTWLMVPFNTTGNQMQKQGLLYRGSSTASVVGQD